MKQFTLPIALLFCVNVVNAQLFKTTTVSRNIRINFINRDSVNLALNENFEMIEDDCAQIIRYGHLHMPERVFTGKVTDVSKANPQLILTEGFYTPDGLKDGPFITRFLSGKLQAKGDFKKGMYDGKWEIFYDNDKPHITFDANGTKIRIIDIWDAKGNKIVNNGTGSYRSELGSMYWKGKLLNGKPDGTWKAINVDNGVETTLLTESFKNGAFQKGNGVTGTYTDSSRISLVSPDLLSFTHAEQVRISMIGCDGVSPFKKTVNARFGNGFNSFSTEIERLMPDALKGVDIRALLFRELVIDGEISTIGRITNLKPQSQLNDGFVRSLIRQLQKLPSLEPATVDGKPVVQKFKITFKFQDGMYSFNYQLLPLDTN